MQVTVYSTLSNHPGEVIVNTNPDDTINDLIAAFCTDQGIAQKRYYVIRDSNQAVLQVCDKLSIAQIQDGDKVYIGMKGRYIMFTLYIE